MVPTLSGLRRTKRKGLNFFGSIKLGKGAKTELAVASSSAADGADMHAIAVAQFLHAMIATVGNNKVAFAVKRYIAKAAFGELPVAGARAADGADVGAVN